MPRSATPAKPAQLPAIDTSTVTFARPWTVSAARSAAECPAQWAHARARAPRVPATLDQARGSVLHAAISAAYRAAQIEGRDRVLGYPTTDTMYRHWLVARRALGIAWEQHKMPSSSAEANAAVEMLSALLTAMPLPRPGEVLGVEQTFEGVTAGGVPIRIQPDLVLRPVSRSGVPGPRVTVVDWKMGHVEKLNVDRHEQLLNYVAVLARTLTGVREFVVELRSIRHAPEAQAALADPDLVAAAVRRFETVAVEREAATEHPTRPGEHCLGCPFRAICPSPWPPATLGLPRNAAGEIVLVTR